ncbi:MAG: chemotaxis protein CheW [bacterium]
MAMALKIREDRRDVTQEDKGTGQYLSFILGEEVFALNLTNSKEILTPQLITGLPRSADYVLGVINLRGKIVPVLDLKKELNLSSSYSGEHDKRIIIITIEDVQLGIMVDAVNEVITVNNNDIQRLSDYDRSISNDYIDGVVEIDEQLLVLININKLVF